MVTVSQMAAVQQQSLAADVGTLATTFATEPSTDITTLQNDYSGTALNTKLAAVTIDKATVESAMTAALPTPAPATDVTNTTTAPTRMEAIKSLAWVAGPVVGGVVLLALVWYWIAKRRAAQAIGMKPEAGAEARGSAEGRDGSTPREAWGANGAPRAQASLGH
ncbi:hypothetical protein OEZ86_003719 [Tetradesmus obliquus]|nr:hypothetical protein OEZ86_003719 [Tetradesmus obliquus]